MKVEGLSGVEGPAGSGLLSRFGPLVLYTALIAPVTVTLFRVTQHYISMWRRSKKLNKLPHEPIHWFWGHANLFPGPYENGLTFFRSLVSKHPRWAIMWMGNLIHPSVFVHHPETMKLILKTTEPKPLGVGIYGYGLPWLGEGLLLASGKKWARNRRLLTPAFHFDILKSYVPVKNQTTDILIDKLHKFAREDQNVEMFGHISLLTFDIILRCAFSYENNVQLEGENHPYVQAVEALGDIWIRRITNVFLHSEFIFRCTSLYRKFKKSCAYVHSISGEVIEKRKKYLTENKTEQMESESRKGRYLDFLDILLTARDSDGNGLTDIEIRNEVDTFLFEGHDTTASSISWTLYSLAENPEHQEMCQREIDEILEGRETDYITCEDLPKLKYLTLCIKESMRCHCPVPGISRETTTELTLDGVTLPKGTYMDIMIYNLHHNEAVWENPMEFRPSRFLPENFDKMDSFSYVPFSAGPRNCIGQHFAMHEQKIILARILRSFTVHTIPNMKAEKKIGVVMKTKDGMYMKVTPRVHSDNKSA